jgi:hypothetical protein
MGSVFQVQEVLSGLFHWTARHPKIGVEVSCYWLEESGVLFDPLVPPQEGLEDSLMDDPPATKRGLLAACSRLLAELDFEHLLLAHGGPVIGDGRELLADLVACGGRTAFEL